MGDDQGDRRRGGLHRGPAVDTTGMKMRRWKMPGPEVTRPRLEAALRGSYGIVARVARRLGVTTDTVRRHLRRPENADLSAALDAEREAVVDDAEDTVAQTVRQRDDPGLAFRASRYVLDARGRPRGWRRELTVSGSQSEPLRVDHSGSVDVLSLGLPLEARRAILEAIERGAPAPAPPPPAPALPVIRVRRVSP